MEAPFLPEGWRAEGRQTLRTARAISAPAWCVSSFGPERVPPSGPDRPKSLLRTPTFRRPIIRPLETGRRTLPARPPPPPVRSPAGRPPQRWGSSDYAGGLERGDKFGSRIFRVLKSLGLNRYPLGIDPLGPSPRGRGGAQAELGRVRGLDVNRRAGRALA